MTLNAQNHPICNILSVYFSTNITLLTTKTSRMACFLTLLAIPIFHKLPEFTLIYTFLTPHSVQDSVR